MKLEATPRRDLDKESDLFYRKVAQQVNGLSEGKMAALYHARPSAPTTGAYAVGDFVANSNVSELGGAGNKYVLVGWQCVVSGDPATFVERRCLTGN
jgi:hypothetical protein